MIQTTIVSEQVERMGISGIMDLGPVTIGVVGQKELIPKCKDILKRPFVYCGDLSKYEFPTLDLLFKWCCGNEGCVWYVHTKGVSKCASEMAIPLTDWRRMMEYFVIDKHARCREILKSSDACGVNLLASTSFFREYVVGKIVIHKNLAAHLLFAAW